MIEIQELAMESSIKSALKLRLCSLGMRKFGWHGSSCIQVLDFKPA